MARKFHLSREDAKAAAEAYNGQVLKLNSGQAVRLGKPRESTRKFATESMVTAALVDASQALMKLEQGIEGAPEDQEPMGDQAEAPNAEEENEGPGDFDMNLYSGGVADVDWWGAMVFDMASGEAPKQKIPALLGHSTANLVGFSEAITLDEKSGIDLSGKILAGSEFPAARLVVSASKQGFPWQASAGISAGLMRFVDLDEEVEVNGQTFQGPLFVAKEWTLLEGSFVPLGADSNTSAVALSSRVDQVESAPEKELEMADKDQAARHERNKILSHFGEKDPKFAIGASNRALNDGLTFEAALIEWSEKVVADSSRATEEAEQAAAAAKTKAQVAASAAPIASSRPAGEAGTARNATAEYKRTYLDLASKHGKAKALRMMARDHEDLRQEMLAEANQG